MVVVLEMKCFLAQTRSSASSAFGVVACEIFGGRPERPQTLFIVKHNKYWHPRDFAKPPYTTM